MHKQLKQWLCVTLFSPAMVIAQSLSDQANQVKAVSTAPTPAVSAAATPIDPAKKTAIKSLLSAIDADKLSLAIANSAQMQAKQLVPAVLTNALAENKKFTEAQKRSLVPQLQKNAIPKLVESAGKVFENTKFHQDAIAAQYKAYADHYTTEEIQSLTKFFLSPSGHKFIQDQPQVGSEIVSGLLQTYMPQSIKATREQADKEIAAAKLNPAAKNSGK